MPDSRKDVKLTIRIPRELRDAAKVKTRQQDLTLSQVIRHYLRVWVKDPPSDGEKQDQ
jgi:predicted HicB family RNase H-like nuclease